MPKSLLRRVSHKIRYDDPSGCWLWTGYIVPAGYAQADRNVRMHRYMFEQIVGPIPPGKDLDHICRVRHCINPDHLEPVEPFVNIMRGISIPATKAQQTHCDKGHEFTEETTYYAPSKPNARRECLICRRERTISWAQQQSPEWHAAKAEYARNYRIRKKLERLSESVPPVVTDALVCGVPCFYGGAAVGKIRYRDEVAAPGRCNRPVHAIGERCWQHQVV